MSTGIQVAGSVAGASLLLLEYRHNHGLAVVGHYLEAVLHDAAQGIQIHFAGAFLEGRLGSNLFHLGQAKYLEQTNPGPAHVELETAHGQLGGVGVGVVVVMQLFATNQDAPGRNIA